MRRAGRVVSKLLVYLESKVAPGLTTKKLDELAEEFIRSNGATPAFKGYYGYPSSICVSVNEEVVHGIPGKRILQDGDIVGVDVGAIVDGFYGDAARTFGVGKIDAESRGVAIQSGVSSPSELSACICAP
jgi:methionyl aminopeptidase